MGSRKPSLVYTFACDRLSGAPLHRVFAKMLVSSLLRTFFTGDILVFRNTPAPLFAVERKGLEEVYVDFAAACPGGTPDAAAPDAKTLKYLLRDRVDAARYEKVMFLDADCLALRNIDHLLEGDWDIAHQPEPGSSLTAESFNSFFTSEELADLRVGGRPGSNSGVWAVRGSRFREVMEAWEVIDRRERLRGQGSQFRDQPAWNRLLFDTGLAKEPFAAGEVAFPLFIETHYPVYKKAALLHICGAGTGEKLPLAFGLWASTFYCDPTALVLDLLEV